MPISVPTPPTFPSERPTTLILAIFELAMGILFMITGIFIVTVFSIFSFILGFFLVYDGYKRLKRFFLKGSKPIDIILLAVFFKNFMARGRKSFLLLETR